MKSSNLPIPPSIQSLQKALSSAPGFHAVSGLWGSSPALVLGGLWANHDGPMLVVVKDQSAAHDLMLDLNTYFGEQKQILQYPAWDVAPYTGLAPKASIPFEQMAVLRSLHHGAEPSLIIATVSSLLVKTIGLKRFRDSCFSLKPEQDIDVKDLGDRLSTLGYLATDKVSDPGSFAMRGDVFDLYAPGIGAPIRLELWGDTIECINTYDARTHKSTGHLESALITPCRPELIGPAEVDYATQWLRDTATQREVGAKFRRRLVEDLKSGIYFPHIEYYRSALSDDSELFFEHLPANTLIIQLEPEALKKELAHMDENLSRAHQSLLVHDPLLPDPNALFTNLQGLNEAMSAFPRRVDLSAKASLSPVGSQHKLKTSPTSGLRRQLLSQDNKNGYMLSPLIEKLKSWNDSLMSPVIFCRSQVQSDRLRELLTDYPIQVLQGQLSEANFTKQSLSKRGKQTSVLLTVGRISAGVAVPTAHIAALSDEDIFGPSTHREASSAQLLKNAIDSFSQLQPGDYVVHALHGIGIFRSLSKLPVGDSKYDFIQLEFSGGDKLYLPVHRLNTLKRYVGKKGAKPKLDKMGGQSWQKTKRKVKQGMAALAQKLLDLYAARSLAQGQAFELDRNDMQEFEATFPYQETPDQLEAIHAVTNDMASNKPMDRLVCGDVGYGKTEVAIRAAYLAVANGRQVALLVPTTILAFQHWQTFKQRFDDMAISTAQLSRFTTAKQRTEILKQLADGTIDIVIGTQKLLNRSIEIKNLGLVIIDEEHRFGVKHKEYLKGLKKNVDVLTMTATPIPRTLHMAMTGLRDLSIIATAPQERLPIRTYVIPFAAARIRDAIQFELKRGGQIYYVHNRVRSSEAMGQYIQSLVPESRVMVAHGQMNERVIEKKMRAFIDGEFDVMVTTTIIESGLDIPRANTIIINRSDQFGLAQLYQLRGRVGRSNQQSYAYLMTPAAGPATKKAERRLKVLTTHDKMGAGFKIANEDLELRGAGSLLGKNQSGSISAVGFETYIDLLQQTVRSLSGQGHEDDYDPEVDIKVSAYIPTDYIEDFQKRLRLYRQLSVASSESEIIEVQEEVAQQYGRIPDPLKLLAGVMEARLMVKNLRLKGLTATANRILIDIDDSALINREALANMLLNKPRRYKLTSTSRLSVNLGPDESEKLLSAVKKTLRKLS